MFRIFTKMIVLVLLAISVTNVSAFTCKFGRSACIASCMGQNCATGYCTGTAPNQICVCSRCNNGPNTWK